MKHEQVKNLTLASMFAALCCVSTMVIQVPSPMNGYVNLGDCFVLLSGFLLGPFYGAAAAGIGCMFADVLTSYAHYAPGTLIIKGLCSLVAALFYKYGGKSTLAAVVGAVCAEVVMVLGYFAYASMLLGRGLGAAASIPGNVVQGVFGIVAGIVLLKVAEKCTPVLRKNRA